MRCIALLVGVCVYVFFTAAAFNSEENEDSTTVVLETQGADRHRATSSVWFIVVSRNVTVVLGVGAVCGESVVAM